MGSALCKYRMNRTYTSMGKRDMCAKRKGLVCEEQSDFGSFRFSRRIRSDLENLSYLLFHTFSLINQAATAFPQPLHPATCSACHVRKSDPPAGVTEVNSTAPLDTPPKKRIETETETSLSLRNIPKHAKKTFQDWTYTCSE